MKFHFKIEKIKEGIYRITEPYYREHANMYLFKGSIFNLLVDSGIGLENIRQFLVEHGFQKIKLFLTHSHYDHAGGLKYFPADEIMMMNKISSNIRDRKLWGLEYLNPKDFNYPPASTRFLVQPRHFCETFKIASPLIKPMTARKISNGSFSFTVLSTPGHTDDSFSLYESKKKILVTGDALYDGEIYMDLQNSHQPDFRKSLWKMESLDFKFVLPGHNWILNRERARIVMHGWLSSL